jgi:hypothetical protein
MTAEEREYLEAILRARLAEVAALKKRLGKT